MACRLLLLLPLPAGQGTILVIDALGPNQLGQSQQQLLQKTAGIRTIPVLALRRR